uniref:Uncharacterized protein n=1 Tax=Sus scrofa TaxID=9823 RepID=A0A8D1VZC8_PIG
MSVNLFQFCFVWVFFFFFFFFFGLFFLLGLVGRPGLGLRDPDSNIPRIFPSPHGLQLVPALDGCLCRNNWLDQQAQTSASVPTSLRSCAVESQPGIFFPPRTGAEFSLHGIPQPHVEPWAFSLDLGLQLAAGSGHLLALGTPENSSWLHLHLQDQVRGGIFLYSVEPGSSGDQRGVQNVCQY